MTQQEPVIEQVPFGSHFDYPADRPPPPYERERRELLARYGRFAQERDHVITSYLIRPSSATDQLVVELFDATNSQLVVTCATLQRAGAAGVWYSIGTLADLARFLPSPTRNILVLPAEPSSDLDGLCAIRSITPVWPVDGTDTFTSHQDQARRSEPLFYPNGEPSL
ncbi:hypothetical protein [Streptomyces sp. NPDC002215]|uniref:hypothetical protein n=1 Tax=Streptomyces sp. NPDC002215 TaxID=3154412 RepID=UPI00331C9B60